MVEYNVVLFYSASYAMRAEKVLEGAGFRIKMIPTPRQLSSDCGMALRYDRKDQDGVAAALKEQKVQCNGMHEL